MQQSSTLLRAAQIAGRRIRKTRSKWRRLILPGEGSSHSCQLGTGMQRLGPALACYAVTGTLCSLELNKRKKKNERRKGLGQVQAAQARKKPDLAVGATGPTVSSMCQTTQVPLHRSCRPPAALLPIATPCCLPEAPLPAELWHGQHFRNLLLARRKGQETCSG